MNNELIRSEIKEIIKNVRPYDDIEEGHIEDAVKWIESGVEIFRIERPDKPAKHLVCYTVIYDIEEQKMLLFEHRKSLLIIPSGGHVDVNELPYDTVKRELKEEIDLDLELYDFCEESPFFVSQVTTVGLVSGHRDVDLWYFVKGNSRFCINEDADDFQREFAGYKWYSLDEILSLPQEKKDFNMDRLVMKIKKEFNIL